MENRRLEINATSIRNELKSYKDDSFACLFEYIWNAFDALASKVWISFDIPAENIGASTYVKIKDNGSGWNFEDENVTKYFLSSLKVNDKCKTIPHGHYGRGRYAFIWIADSITFKSGGKYLKLNHSTDIERNVDEFSENGTLAVMNGLYPAFSDALNSKELTEKLILEFGYFLKQNDDYEIFINNEKLDVDSFIEQECVYEKKDMPEDVRGLLEDEFSLRIVLWNAKLAEYSKYYFLSLDGKEIMKSNTGLNKKKDEFWHSVYVKTDVFVDSLPFEEDDSNRMVFSSKDVYNAKKKIVEFAKEKLILLRKPLLQKNAEIVVEKMKSDGIYPSLQKFGIYDESSFDDLMKTVYTISPSSFVGKSEGDKRFFCATLASLLASQDDDLIPVLLEQVQNLTEEEKRDLLDILKRTSLSNVVRTIKEIDHRLDVLEKLMELLFVRIDETLEVKHLQKILNENFWIFGEQFRLFSTTEGPLHKTLHQYAEEILGIENPELSGKSRKELDLFLTKTDSYGQNVGMQKNIIVEIKRPNVVLGKGQYDQIEHYMEVIRNQPVCNGSNQQWEFYLIGDSYNSHIEDKIDSAKNHGEQERGLALSVKNGQFKIYVRKWSDILEVEWGTKMKCLKEKLQIQAKPMPETSQEITDNLIK